MTRKTESCAADFAEGFARRHRRIAPILDLLQLEVADGPQTSVYHGEAHQVGDHRVLLLPKFWELPEDVRDFVFAHEAGHAAHSQYSLVRLIGSAQELGIEVWDQSALPFGQYNMGEAFADSFATYLLNPEELSARYPAWVDLVEAVLAALAKA